MCMFIYLSNGVVLFFCTYSVYYFDRLTDADIEDFYNSDDDVDVYEDGDDEDACWVPEGNASDVEEEDCVEREEEIDSDNDEMEFVSIEAEQNLREAPVVDASKYVAPDLTEWLLAPPTMSTQTRAANVIRTKGEPFVCLFIFLYGSALFSSFFRWSI